MCQYRFAIWNLPNVDAKVLVVLHRGIDIVLNHIDLRQYRSSDFGFGVSPPRWLVVDWLTIHTHTFAGFLKAFSSPLTQAIIKFHFLTLIREVRGGLNSVPSAYKVSFQPLDYS